MAKKIVVIGMAGPTLDGRLPEERWKKWRPTIAIGLQKEFTVNRFELLVQEPFEALGQQLKKDFNEISPATVFRTHTIHLEEPWDFETVYAALLDFAKSYPFDPDNEDYLVHITTGTHVIQICLFLLVESRIIPARLLQTGKTDSLDRVGKYAIIDLDLSRYDKLAERFNAQRKEGQHFLSAGIETRNPAYNRMLEQITRVCERSRDPILLEGASGVGKTRLARLIYEWKKKNGRVSGAFVELNCAIIRDSIAMSTLFGHKKGAYTGATENRAGMLSQADGGLLFLDEIGELGIDEQAMLLRAIEEKRFYPMGSDMECTSNFQLICGTNSDLHALIRKGRFRQDLLARINLWTFRLPSLKDRPEDIEPNLTYELERISQSLGKLVRMNKEAKDLFLKEAIAPESLWTCNFRDFAGAVTRMAVLAENGRITQQLVEDELKHLRQGWREASDQQEDNRIVIESILGDATSEIDPFDIPQLANVIRVCQQSKSLSDAGRKLFSESLKRKKSTNDSDRLRKYLAGFGLNWGMVSARN